MIHNHIIRIGGDIIAVSLIIGTLLSWLPNIATALSIIWLLMQIGDWIYKKWKSKQNGPSST